MKVLQRKILILVISSVLISALLVMMIAFFNYDRIITNNSKQIMQLMCSEKRQTIDERLSNIEQSVNALYYFAVEQISKTDDMWQDDAKVAEHVNSMEELMSTTAKYTDGAVTVYYRLNPSLHTTEQGAWLVQDESGNFVKREATEITQYDKDDVEHVGWYYIPIENGKETWINPYFNQNMGEEIISYVIPVIIENEVIGVVGMDISTDLLYEYAKMVSVYDTGYAFLMDNEGRFVYHPEMAGSNSTPEFDTLHAYLFEKSLLSVENKSVEDYRWNDIDKKLTSQKLRNGMIFTVCVPEQEIRETQQKTLLDSARVILFVMAAYIIVTVSITRAIVKMMYSDSMTRVGNKKAYFECVDTLSKKIKNKNKIEFTVIIVDINDLKKVNDTYGHEYGDILIQSAASILKKVWERKNIYRIGGDEFAIVYSDVKKVSAGNQMHLLEEEIKNYNQYNNNEALYLQMAAGMASYNYETDKEYMDVFRRADDAMYENKKSKKIK